MDFTLTEEQEPIRRTARELAERELAPPVRDWDRAEYEGTSEIQKLIIGRALTGESAFV